jgi:hypothetical protein
MLGLCWGDEWLKDDAGPEAYEGIGVEGPLVYIAYKTFFSSTMRPNKTPTHTKATTRMMSETIVFPFPLVVPEPPVYFPCR